MFRTVLDQDFVLLSILIVQIHSFFIADRHNMLYTHP